MMGQSGKKMVRVLQAKSLCSCKIHYEALTPSVTVFRDEDSKKCN